MNESRPNEGMASSLACACVRSCERPRALAPHDHPRAFVQRGRTYTELEREYEREGKKKTDIRVETRAHVEIEMEIEREKERERERRGRKKAIG